MITRRTASAVRPTVRRYGIWQIHSLGQNVMFADGHSKWYKGFNPGEMTFSYTAMTGWISNQ